MNKLLYFILFMPYLSCNIGVDCERFKVGHFILKPNSTTDEYYFNIYRNNEEQVEIDSNGKKTSLYVDWISKCSYEVRSIPNRGNEFKAINDSSVIRIEIYKTIQDTAFYNTYVMIKEGEISARSGKMIRIGDNVSH